MPTRTCAKADDKRVVERGMPGAGLTRNMAGQVSADRLALKPYWGKPAVRNFREGDGDVGIIRSPLRAITLPDQSTRNRKAPVGSPFERHTEGARTSMRFLPYAQASSVPNVIVDGARTENTVLTLSHWPKSGTPAELKGDTSTAIVFNYLDSPQFHVEADVVSNNHFDEDGLVGIFALLEPAMAEHHRDMLADVAQAGDFGIFSRRQAARIAFTLSAHVDRDTSPLPKRLFELPYSELASELYVRLLDVLPRLLTSVDDYRSLWESEDARLTASEELIENGLITIDERPDLDLAVVRMPEDLTRHRVHRFTQPRLAECHPFALHNRTACTRLLVLQGCRVELQYRYEGWVQMASRRPAPRVDLSGLANELNHEEGPEGRWVFDGVDQITPRLHLEGSPATSVPPEAIVRRVEHHLRTGPSAWNPYD